MLSKAFVFRGTDRCYRSVSTTITPTSLIARQDFIAGFASPGQLAPLWLMHGTALRGLSFLGNSPAGFNTCYGKAPR